ncbi:MAG: DUF4180 domain-containing protein [Anaerolineae bacterium]|nr:DUF4180 domain-containing protein [Anaerolineae bacterium]
MNYRAVEKNEKIYVECLADGVLLDGEAAALDLVAGCMEYTCNRLLLPEGVLPDTFFQLKSGVAGQVLQKFVNYHMRVAAVIDPRMAREGRFGEMVLEANRGNQFRVFDDRAQAEDWLLAD